MRPIDYAVKSCDTMMRKFAACNLPPKGHFHYHQGVFLHGMQATYKLTGDEKYYEYIKAYVDAMISDDGNINDFNPGQLDDLQPGVLLYDIYRRTGNSKYKKALDTIAYYIETFPRCENGGFWHKAWFRHQMWLDGLYMGGPVMAQYAAEFGKPEYFDMICEQVKIMRSVTCDSKTGLWYHAWDEEKMQDWADSETGRSPEFWGRSMGWVPVAILNELDFMPEEHPGRADQIAIMKDLLMSLIPYQDEKTGMWYQVTDKGDNADNWLEVSCSCLYTAAIAKAVRMGYLDKAYLAMAKKGFEGVINAIGQDEDNIYINGVCIGTGVGDYRHYINRPTSENDLHGVGAFLIMCTEMQMAEDADK